jgi:type IV secretory pathway protease TraF
VPIGLYWIAAATLGKGELAVVRLPDVLRTLAAVRGYLAERATLIKPVAATMGDLVCRHGATVTINGQVAVHALASDGLGRLLPQWTGCITLAAGQVFLLSTAPAMPARLQVNPAPGAAWQPIDAALRSAAAR